MKRIVSLILVILFINTILIQQGRAQHESHIMNEFPGVEMEETALKFIETYHPSRLEDIKRMKVAQPQRYSRIINEIWRRAEQLIFLKGEDPKRYEIEIRQEQLDEETLQLAQAYQNAKNEKEKEGIKRKLKASVNEQFNLREQIKESELKRMESELQHLKEKLRNRQANKSEIVEYHVNQLLNKSAGLGWE